MDKNVADKVTSARITLINGHPFFGTLSLGLEILADDTVPTMGVDGKHLYYNPAWADSLPFDELTGVMAHETMHCALGHHVRFGKRDHETWNEACDHVINPILREAGFALPSDGLSVDKARFPGKAAEEVYSTLWNAKQKAAAKAREKMEADAQRERSRQGGESGQGGDGKSDQSKAGESSKPSQDGRGSGTDQQPKPERSKSKGGGSGAPDDDQNDDNRSDGEGDGGQPEPKPEHPKDVGGCGSFSAPREDDGKVASPETLAEQQRKWQVAMSQAVAVAKKAGDIPGSLMTAIDGLRKPEVDWREQLRRFVDSASKQNYTWLVPNRRHVADGVYLPSLTNDGLGDIVFAIDTSGSMNTDALQMAVDELNAILNDLQPESVHVMQCDTTVNEVEEVHAGDYPIKVTAKGRGGTLFTPVFDEIEKRELRPVCMIYFTDLYADDFPVEPNYPVIWCSPPNASTVMPPFGESIKIIADGR